MKLENRFHILLVSSLNLPSSRISPYALLPQPTLILEPLLGWLREAHAENCVKF